MLCALTLAGGGICVGLDKILLPSPALPQARNSFAGGEMLGIVPFAREGRPAMDTPIGEELDGRLYTDLSALTPEQPVTPAERFYLRTRASALLKDADVESIELRGLTRAPLHISAEELRAKARPMGRHLMECAGNTRDGRFGLISVADWTGVPLTDVLERLPAPNDHKGPRDNDARILVSGFDTYASQSGSSTPGASWIFSRDDLRSTGAFLATEMEGQPLTRGRERQ